MFNTDFMAPKDLLASIHAPYVTNTKPVRKQRVSSKIARSPKKGRLNSTTEAAPAVVMDGDVLDVTEAAETSHLSSEVVVFQEAFLQAMMTVCCIFIKVFWNIQETHRIQGSEYLAKSVGLLLCDPPNNVRRQQDL